MIWFKEDHNFCIVDEVDSILIDESRTPLIISGKLEDKTIFIQLPNEFIKVFAIKVILN